MGGYRCHQRTGQGSEFWFRVRLEQVERPEALNERLQHISLLIADDNQVTRDALSMTVGSLGWSLGWWSPVSRRCTIFKDQREAALASGMNDFIAKPLDVEQLIATLLRYLPDCVLPLTVSDEPRAQEPVAGIDIDTGLRNWGEASVYLKYLRRFRDDYMTVGTVLPDYIAQHETDAAASLTHKIKGVAGSLSLTDVARISAELNEAIEQGGDTSQLIAPFLEALEQAQHAIDTYAGREPGAVSSPLAQGEAREVCLHALHQALVSEDLDLIEPALSQARSYLPCELVSEISAALELFDIPFATRKLEDYLEDREEPAP
ncbi:Hpt domain-containing protein [Aeromonas caviae]|uniref:Hpt domain-containing protein n=1 Tax=Aeromonas caviae TaxID=648 RepID=UPI001F4DB26D|nr:Hpt domain-containing protein [Aeromonas caviae]